MNRFFRTGSGSVRYLSIGPSRCFVLFAPWMIGVRLGPYWLRAGWIQHVLYSGRANGRTPGWNVWLDRDRAGVGP